MKKPTIAILMLLVGLGVTWLVWRSRPEARHPMSSSSSVTDTTSSTQTLSAVAVANPRQASARASSSARASDTERAKRSVDAIASAFRRPLAFYGRVTDERDVPISAAMVSFSLIDNPEPGGSGTRGNMLSDQDGRFVVSGFGMGIHVEVSKNGYYRVPEIGGRRGSYGGFRNHNNLGNTDVPMPTKEMPAVFVLRKMGEAVPLVHLSSRSIVVPNGGPPTEVDLATGQIVAKGDGQLRVEISAQNRGMDPNKAEPYDWRCQLTIPGGGLLERKGPFDFEAPEAGYTPTVEFVESASAKSWRPSAERQFFVHLADNRYARVNVAMNTGDQQFIVMEAFINPTPGSRNLEFDPAKTIEQKP